ncbi:MAG: LacI family DNA-binding transcriptional regulator [Spirochaetales bacterium]|nr:LacI family DNA-binding transcriptional regulator [Spirochaetales bacterium]
MSIPTVSLVLSGKGRISVEVRDRVMKVAGDLGYFKSQQQNKGREHSNRNIGMLYSFDTNWTQSHGHLAPLVVSIEEVLQENGHFLSIVTFTQKMSAEELFDRILHDNLKAMLSINFADKTLFARLEEIGIPVVLVNNLEYQDLFYTAGVDDFQGTYEAANYLINLGHKNIAYFDYPEGQFHPMANRRFHAYRAALEEAGNVPTDNSRVRVDVNDQDSLLKSITALQSMNPRPTAFMSDDDNIMMAVLHAAKSLGIRIPEDVSAIAHGDTQDYNRVDTPPLTTMRINMPQLGKLAAEMLINRLNHRLEETQVVKLKEQMVDRGSCRSIV